MLYLAEVEGPSRWESVQLRIADKAAGPVGGSGEGEQEDLEARQPFDVEGPSVAPGAAHAAADAVEGEPTRPGYCPS